MNNASLKEQLESLGLSPSHEKSQAKQNKKKFRPEKNNTAKKPSWLEQAQYGIELLKAYFPACFKEVKEVQPLKIGIKQDLVKHLSTLDHIVIGDKACMVSSLAYYVNSPAYHKCMIEGASRIDLNGHPSGIVTLEEAQYSLECRQAKLQKKSALKKASQLKE